MKKWTSGCRFKIRPLIQKPHAASIELDFNTQNLQTVKDQEAFQPKLIQMICNINILVAILDIIKLLVVMNANKLKVLQPKQNKVLLNKLKNK